MKHDDVYYSWSDSKTESRGIEKWKYAMDVPNEDNNKQELIKKADELIKLSDELMREGAELKKKAVEMKADANKL